VLSAGRSPSPSAATGSRAAFATLQLPTDRRHEVEQVTEAVLGVLDEPLLPKVVRDPVGASERLQLADAGL
jgi:hypothetical protein